jgi:hypothetical protein
VAPKRLFSLRCLGWFGNGRIELSWRKQLGQFLGKQQQFSRQQQFSKWVLGQQFFARKQLLGKQQQRQFVRSITNSREISD